MLSAQDIMSQSVQRLERGTSAQDAAKVMADTHVGSIIVTAGGYPIGIVTETDITRLVAQSADLKLTLIEEIMSSPLFSTTADTDIIQIANTMAANRIKKMPVIDKQQVIGIITQTDIVKHVLAAFTELRAALKEGSISPNEFEERTSELFATARMTAVEKKHWHMICRSCGLRFMNAEQDGKLETTSCPHCSGAIMYDPTPPI